MNVTIVAPAMYTSSNTLKSEAPATTTYGGEPFREEHHKAIKQKRRRTLKGEFCQEEGNQRRNALHKEDAEACSDCSKNASDPYACREKHHDLEVLGRNACRSFIQCLSHLLVLRIENEKQVPQIKPAARKPLYRP